MGMRTSIPIAVYYPRQRIPLSAFSRYYKRRFSKLPFCSNLLTGPYTVSGYVKHDLATMSGLNMRSHKFKMFVQSRS